MKFEKKNIKWIVLGILLILFVEIIENVLNNDFLKYDMMIYNWIPKTDTLTMIMKCITQIGSTIGMLILTIIFAFYIKPRKKAVLVPINLVIITVLNQTLKFIIQRPRPTDINMITEIGYSFPSGHTMTSVAFFGLLIYLLYKSKISQNKKILLSILLTFLVCLIGLSRIYLGVHYFSDVLGGIVIGVAYLIIFTSVTKSLGVNYEDNK